MLEQPDMDNALAKDVMPRAPSETNLATALLAPELKVLLLTAAKTKHGTTSSALTLAGELANASRGRVLLIDASLSAHSFTHQTHLAEHPGFLDLMQAKQPPELFECIWKPHTLPFHFMPLGGAKDCGQRLSPEPLRQLFQRLGELYRFVVIDGDAIYANADTLAISALADGVVLVVRAEETRWEVAQAAVQRLNQAGAKLIGSVFNARRYYMPKWLYDYL